MRIVIAALAALGLAATAPAGAKVLDSSPAGFTLENSIEVPVDAETAWNALVENVEQWWPRDHRWWADSRLSIDPQAGGCFCERAGNRQAMHLQVTFVDPGKTLRMTGGLGPLQAMGLHGALEFRLSPAGHGGTRITLWYRAGGYTPAAARAGEGEGGDAGDAQDLVWFAPIVDRVQAQQLGGLGAFLAPRPRAEEER